MNFNFNQVSTVNKQNLAPNKIYTVQFKGCEIKDFEKNGTLWKTLDITFESQDGKFRKTFFEPKDSDCERRSFDGGRTYASNMENMMLIFKHLIDATNPTLGQEINNNIKQISAPNWDALRKFMVQATESGIDKQMKIKLLVNNKGEADFPKSFSIIDDVTNKAKLINNFIGDNVYFSKYEMDLIKKSESKPDNIAEQQTQSIPTSPAAVVNPYADTTATGVGDLNFNL